MSGSGSDLFAWIRIRFSNFSGAGSGFQIALDPDRIRSERLDPDPDPVNPESRDPDLVNVLNKHIDILAFRGNVCNQKDLLGFIGS